MEGCSSGLPRSSPPPGCTRWWTGPSTSFSEIAMRLAILEPLSVFAMIMAYIWELRFSNRWLWLAILVLVLISHLLHGERPGELGFNGHNLRRLVREFAPALAL